jgi:nitroreductase
MELNDAIYGRRATRSFTGDGVDQAALEKLIDAAIHAPSAMNEQAWGFCVIRDAALLARISQGAKALMLKKTADKPASSLHFGEMLGHPGGHPTGPTPATPRKQAEMRCIG